MVFELRGHKVEIFTNSKQRLYGNGQPDSYGGKRSASLRLSG